MTIEQMTPEEEVRLRLAAGISPSTPTEYMLRHIPLWVKMSILRRNTGVVFNPISLFKGGAQGVWYDPSDLSTLFQDAEGTIPVTADGDPVGLMLDKSGNDNPATQSISTSRPTYRTDGVLHWMEFDGVDDHMRVSNYRLPLQGDWDLCIGHRLKVVPTTGENGLFSQYVLFGRGRLILRMGTTGEPATSDLFFGGVASDPALPITTSPDVASARREESLFTYASGGGISTLGSVDDIADTGIIIGSSTGVGGFYRGKIFGAVVRSGVFTATEKQKCNNYIGSKIQ